MFIWIKDVLIVFLSPGQSLVPEQTHQVAQTESGAAAGQTGQTGSGCSATESRISGPRRRRRCGRGFLRLGCGGRCIWWLRGPLLTIPAWLLIRDFSVHSTEKGESYLQLWLFNRFILIYLIFYIYSLEMKSYCFMSDIFSNIFQDFNADSCVFISFSSTLYIKLNKKNFLLLLKAVSSSNKLSHTLKNQS